MQEPGKTGEDRQAQTQQPRKSFGWGCVLIAFLAIVAYLPALRGGFIWDDDAYVTQNQMLRTVSGLQKVWTTPDATPQYYPLVFTSFWVDYRLWGAGPFGYHLVNVLLHLINAILLWRVLARLEVPGSWWAAAAFALHPVQVESVAWITERKNVLSGLFYLLAMLAYVHFRPLVGSTPVRSRDWRFYPLVVAMFVCALLSKTVTCSLPAVLILLIWWKRGRVERRDVFELAPLFLGGMGFGLLTAWLEKHHVGASGTEWSLSVVERGLVAGRALCFYTGKLLWPSHLTFIYPRWTIHAAVWWQYAFPLGVVAVLVTLWSLRRRIGRGPLVAVLCFAGTLVPALGFFDVFPFRYSFVADHFQYLASLGPIALAASVGATLFRRAGRRGRFVVIFTAAAVLTALGTVTWRQGLVYQDLETLWRDTQAKNPEAWLAHNNLGIILAGQGKVSEAIAEFRAALRVNPDYFEAHDNLALRLALGGQMREAIEQYEQALRLQPGYAEAHYNLGNILASQGKVSEAVAEFRAALRLKPEFAEGHNKLALALALGGQMREAIEQYEQALRLQPDYAEAHYNLAWLLATLAPAAGGDPVRAVTLARRACDLTGNQVPAYLDTLAITYAAAGRFDEAIATAQKAIDLARSAGQAQWVGGMESRLELYRGGHPFRQSANAASPRGP